MRIPLFSMSFIVDQTQRAIAGSRDFFEVMDLKPSIIDKPHARELRITKGRIEFKNVIFSYNDEEQVLRKVNFDVAPGSKVALVGESGEGKSTIASLLMRLYEPESGKVTIDGADISDVTQQSLRDNIAVVFQEPAPFSGTVSENIAYAKPDASEKVIIAAAKAANAHDFISKLSKGYQTEIGERGVKLSGGQKQRLAIARALLKDAPILILDEATSSLDSRAEAQVQEALEVLMQNRTTLIIAHRLSTIAHVDRIVTIKGGKVDEVGTPKQLAKTKGIYAELLQLQLGVNESAREKLKEFDMVTE
jgi:ATP-binding cassette subfamily B protein